MFSSQLHKPSEKSIINVSSAVTLFFNDLSIFRRAPWSSSKRLSYGLGSNPRGPAGSHQTGSVKSALNGYASFPIGRAKREKWAAPFICRVAFPIRRAKKEKWAAPFICHAQDIVSLYPLYITATRLCKTLPFKQVGGTSAKQHMDENEVMSLLTLQVFRQI